MAKIDYWNYPPEWLPLIKKILAWNDRFFFVSVRKKTTFNSRQRKAGITQRSLQKPAADLWATLTEAEKDLWRQASANEAQKSFNLFLQEFANAYINNLEPPLLPSQYAQNKVGRIVLGNPAAGILLLQEHPFKYKVRRKVTGSRDMYELIEITENFSFPFTIGISYHTELINTHGTSVVRFYVDVLSHYQGRDIKTLYEISMGLQDDWTRQEIPLVAPLGFVKSYNAYIDLQNVQGTFEWDNVLLEHSGQNWARDFRCNNVATDFTKAFADMAKHWEAEIQPAGAFYNSVYRLL